MSATKHFVGKCSDSQVGYNIGGLCNAFWELTLLGTTWGSLCFLPLLSKMLLTEL